MRNCKLSNLKPQANPIPYFKHDFDNRPIKFQKKEEEIYGQKWTLPCPLGIYDVQYYYFAWPPKKEAKKKKMGVVGSKRGVEID